MGQAAEGDRRNPPRPPARDSAPHSPPWERACPHAHTRQPNKESAKPARGPLKEMSVLRAGANPPPLHPPLPRFCEPSAAPPTPPALVRTLRRPIHPGALYRAAHPAPSFATACTIPLQPADCHRCATREQSVSKPPRKRLRHATLHHLPSALPPIALVRTLCRRTHLGALCRAAHPAPASSRSHPDRGLPARHARDSARLGGLAFPCPRASVGATSDPRQTPAGFEPAFACGRCIANAPPSRPEAPRPNAASPPSGIALTPCPQAATRRIAVSRRSRGFSARRGDCPVLWSGTHGTRPQEAGFMLNGGGVTMAAGGRGRSLFEGSGSSGRPLFQRSVC